MMMMMMMIHLWNEFHVYCHLLHCRLCSSVCGEFNRSFFTFMFHLMMMLFENDITVNSFILKHTNNINNHVVASVCRFKLDWYWQAHQGCYPWYIVILTAILSFSIMMNSMSQGHDGSLWATSKGFSVKRLFLWSIIFIIITIIINNTLFMNFCFRSGYFLMYFRDTGTTMNHYSKT